MEFEQWATDNNFAIDDMDDLLALVDKAVETRLPAAQAAVRKARARHPHGGKEKIKKCQY